MKRASLLLNFLLFGLLLSGSISVGYAQAKQPYLFYNGVKSMSMGDTASASKFFKGVLEVNKTHLPSLYYLSRLEAMSGDLEQANAYMNTVERFDTTNTVFLDHKLHLEIDLKNYKEAQKIQKSLIHKEPTNKDLYFIGIGLKYQVFDVPGVLELCKEYEQKFGYDPQIVDYHRGAYIQSKKYFEARSYMQDVVNAVPDNADYVLTLAELSAALGMTSEAEKLFEDALEIDPQSVAVRQSRANFLQHQGRTAEYIDELAALFSLDGMSAEQKVSIFKSNFLIPEPYKNNYFKIQNLISTLLMKYPKDNAVRMAYGNFLTYTGQIEEALKHYEEMLVGDSSLIEPKEVILDIRMYQKEYDKSLAIAKELYDREGESRYLEVQVASLWLSGDVKEAIKYTKKGLKEFKSDSLQGVYYGLQGDIYHEVGKDRQCFAAYKKALKYNPENVVVLNNYAYYLSLRGERLQEALEMSSRANELEKDNPTYLDTQAWILFCLGEYVDAQMLMRRVMALDANPSADVLLHYGDILYALGDDFLARNYWKKAADAGADADQIQLRSMRPKAIRPAN